MEGWTYWEGKQVFIILKNSRRYQGTVLEIDTSALPIVWMILNDKFNKRITFSVEEIDVIQEEGE